MICGHFFNGIVNEGQSIIEGVDTPMFKEGVGGFQRLLGKTQYIPGEIASCDRIYISYTAGVFFLWTKFPPEGNCSPKGIFLSQAKQGKEFA